MALQTVGIVGAGAWGTALGVTARRAGRDVLIWAYEPEVIRDINEQHRNALYLPGVALDEGIEATARFNEVATCDLLLMVTPAQSLRAIAGELAPYIHAGQPLVICAKGIEQTTGKLLSEVVGEVLPAAEPAVLSGPGFAGEIARGLPAAVTLATAQESEGRELAHALSHPSFRCYWSEDVTGAEIGGAVKNVFAIAAGIVMGKKLGASAAFALAYRICGRRSVAEGVTSAPATLALAQRLGIDMPIAQAVHAVISGLATVDEAIEALLARPLRSEG